MKRPERIQRILFTALIIAIVGAAGCGGGKGGSSPVAPAAPSGSQETRNIAGYATATARPPADPNYVGIPARPSASGRVAASLPADTIQIVLTPSTQGMSFQAQCGADFMGRDGSVRTQDIWLAMAVDPCWKYDGLIQFDLSPLAGIPADKILLAEMQLYQYFSFGDYGRAWGYNFEVAAYPNTSAWDEATAWYYNQPGYDVSVTDNRIVITSDFGWRTWDVSDTARRWQSGLAVNYGLRLQTLFSGAPYDSSVFFYDEVSGGQQIPSLTPRLVIYLPGDLNIYDVDGDTIPTASDKCPGVFAPRVLDIDSDGCIDSLSGLLALVAASTMDPQLQQHLLNEIEQAISSLAPGTVIPARMEAGRASTTSAKNGGTDRAVRILNRMLDEIERQKGRKIPVETADLLIAYIRSVLRTLTPA